MMQRRSLVAAAWFSVAIAGMACGDDSASGTGGAGAATTSTSSSASGGGDAGGGGGSAGGNAASGYCAKGCSMRADCCPMGATDCPSDRYPNNWTCESDGICGPPQCAAKEDCTAMGTQPDYDCVSISGSRTCAGICLLDTDCTAPNRCTGVADDMTKYCQPEVVSTECTTDAECHGFGRCDEGSCVCVNNADCTSVYVDTCVK